MASLKPSKIVTPLTAAEDRHYIVLQGYIYSTAG